MTSQIGETGAEVTGIDPSEDMIVSARANHPDLNFVRATAESFRTEDRFDAVFSNAALHWIPDDQQGSTLEAVWDLLRPNGRFVAEMGATGNVVTIIEAIQEELKRRDKPTSHPWYFPSLGTYTHRLEQHRFEVQYARVFDRPTPVEEDEGLSEWLHQFGEKMFPDMTEGEKSEIIRNLEDRLEESLHDGEKWVLDYRRLRFVARVDA